MSVVRIAEPSLGAEELNNVVEAVQSGWISSQGKFIPEFEQKFARYCGAQYGVASSNGTVALHLALKALGVGKGDEVIVPDLTFIATANAVTHSGAEPVLVDSHPSYWCIDPERIEKSITKRTRAIIPVHLYGHPCDMEAISAIAARHRLYVIEDAAEAHGAALRGRKVGSFGHVSCFSFYGNKIITTGEGGMCLTGDQDLAQRMRILRDHGADPARRYWHDVIGYNYRMTNLQAAVGCAQVDRLDSLIERRRLVSAWYDDALRHGAEIGVIRLPPRMPWAESVCWLYSILIEDSFGPSRDDIMGELARQGIETRPFFYPLHVMPPHFRDSPEFPVATELSRKGLSLPSGANITEEIAARIAGCLTALCRQRH
jgi:perosamine synthetase